MQDGRKAKKKKVLITGSSGAIGKAIALSMAKPNVCLGLHYNSNEAVVKRLASSLTEEGVESFAIRADLSVSCGRSLLTEKVRDVLGGCDILINNAGNAYATKRFEEYTEEDVDRIIGLNFLAPFFLCQSFFPEMCNREYGRIVNISSIGVKFGGGDRSIVYAAAKGSLEVLTKNLARRGAKSNVLVNAVRPGVIDTPFHKANKKNMAKRVSCIPIGRMGTPDEIASMVSFLASDKASFITGGIFPVAGGE